MGLVELFLKERCNPVASAAKADRRLLALIVLLAAGIFVLDLVIPLGVAGGVLYVVVVLLSLQSGRRHYTWLTSAAASALTILGLMFSPSGGTMWMVLFNRFLALFAIWATAILSVKYGEVTFVRGRVTGERTRLFTLVLIMTGVSLVVGGIAVSALYRAAIEQTQQRLVEIAQSQARLIEAVARFDAEFSEDFPAGSEAATLSQIIDAHEQYEGFGETGEFALAKRDGDRIVFLLSHRHHDLESPMPILWGAERAEPMRRALSGKSDTLIGLDYRGKVVLAAHEPVAELDLGIVAKIDLAEVRAPFVKAALLGFTSAVVVVFLASLLFLRISNPLIRRLEQLYEMAQQELAERKQAEQELAKLNEELEERVEQRSRELRDAQDQLVRRERLALLGQLSGGMAHEIRNPLAVIKNAVYYLRETGDQFDEESRQCLHEIETEVKSANHIITELLDYTRDPKHSSEQFPLREAVERALKTTEIPDSIHLERAACHGVLDVSADRGQVERIVGNLLRNAVQAMPDGGTLTVTCNANSGEATVTVKDTGLGIADEDLQRVFEPLFTRKAKGIGLGLAISKRYADLHHGRLEVQSKLGQGSTFQLILPLAGEEKESKEP